MEKKTGIKKEVAIPENVTITITDGNVTVTGEKGTLTRQLVHPKVNMKVEKENVEITCVNSPKRREKAFIGTFTAHIKNMIKGVSEGYEYKMKTVFSHFPIKTSVEGQRFVIQNFLGERSPRKAVILEGVDVTVDGENVTVSGINKELVGQTVANIERATKVKHRDIRVFQDGVYMISKGG